MRCFLLLLLQIAGYLRYPWPLLKTLMVVRAYAL
jgi:hypothetical protein